MEQRRGVCNRVRRAGVRGAAFPHTCNSRRVASRQWLTKTASRYADEFAATISLRSSARTAPVFQLCTPRRASTRSAKMESPR